METESEKIKSEKPKKKRRPWWLRLIKWVSITMIILVVLFLLVIGVAVWILTPERLTPLVEKYGSEYLNGELKVERVELTYWSTFPQLLLDIQDLRLISHSLNDITPEERAKLPANADTLLTVNSFHGGINLLDLLRKRVTLTDLTINQPKAVVVDVKPGVSNYNIFPPSEPDTTTTEIPDIALNRFEITGDMPIRYVSLSDSIDVSLTLTRSALGGENSPAYNIAMAGDASSKIGAISLENLKLGMGGDVVWSRETPYKIELKDFEAGVNKINTKTNALIDFSGDLTVERLEFEMPQVAVNEFISLVPKDMRQSIKGLTNNLEVSMKAKLTKPYVPSVRPLPSMELSMNVPKGKIKYQQFSLQALSLDMKANIDGENPDRSTVDIKKLFAMGEGITASISGHADHLLSNPHAKGKFQGGVKFSQLPSMLTQLVGANVSGMLTADAEFDLKKSDLTPENFHNLKLKGEASLLDFNLDMPGQDIKFYTHETRMRFGSSSSFVRGDVTVDSLLTASVKSDTISFAIPGYEGQGKNIRLGGGIKNNGLMPDKKTVKPISVFMAMDRFKVISLEDSMRVRLREIKARASIRRFRDMAKVPEMKLAIDAKRISYADKQNRASMRNSNLNFTLHPSKPRISKSVRAALDSLRAIYPDLGRDSLMVLANKATEAGRAKRKAQRDSITAATKAAGQETFDFDLNDDTRNLLRKWTASGTIKSERVRVLTPYFPLRNVMTNLDVSFNNDSIIVNKTKLKSGESDFTLSGTISNLSRALTSRSGRQALRLNLRLTSDTINVNHIAAAVFAGAAYAEKERKGVAGAISDSDDDEAVQRSIMAQTDTTQSGPLIIPTNIEGTLRVNAHNVIYSDFLFNTLRGSIEIFDGALNMRNLSARTEAGGVDLTALYNGLDRNHLSFAFGMQVRDFRIGRFMQLVPSLDSIMPLLRDINGIINGEIAATTDLDTMMNLKIPTLNAAISLDGDSLVLLDAETFRKIGKWLLFKKKDRNVIDHMSVKLVIKDSQLELFPFIFDMDRYRLGVFGSNDLALNFKYHVAVLKSPIPFRFGINISGNPDKMKIRLGGAKINEKNVAEKVAISDTTRINLVNQIESLFRRGVNQARRAGGNLRLETQSRGSSPSIEAAPDDTISSADSLVFIQQGLLPPKDTVPTVQTPPTKKK